MLSLTYNRICETPVIFCEKPLNISLALDAAIFSAVFITGVSALTYATSVFVNSLSLLLITAFNSPVEAAFIGSKGYTSVAPCEPTAEAAIAMLLTSTVSAAAADIPLRNNAPNILSLLFLYPFFKLSLIGRIYLLNNGRPLRFSGEEIPFEG